LCEIGYNLEYNRSERAFAFFLFLLLHVLLELGEVSFIDLLQLLSSSIFDYFSALNDHYPLALLHSGKSVSNDDGGPVLHDVLQSLLHLLLRVLIEGTGGFVQDEDLGLPDDGSGNGNPLLLAS